MPTTQPVPSNEFEVRTRFKKSLIPAIAEMLAGRCMTLVDFHKYIEQHVEAICAPIQLRLWRAKVPPPPEGEGEQVERKERRRRQFRKLRAAEVKRLVDLYETDEEMTVPMLAERFRTTQMTIARILRQHEAGTLQMENRHE